jgi:hypothetical protein
MKECIACKEKDKRIKALITGHKRLQKVILGLMITLIVTAFLGNDGIMLIADLVKGVIE